MNSKTLKWAAAIGIVKWTIAGVLLLVSSHGLEATSTSSSESPSKIGFVNFRRSVEESKLGKQQQSSFEGLQSQMETSLMEMQKSLNDITTKLSDEDYLDGLSPEAENELKHKYRALSQELSRTQGQYVQTLQDANLKIIQQISTEVGEAAKEVAKVKNLDLVVNEEATFFHKPSLDLTSEVIAFMDAKFEKELKANPTRNAPQTLPKTAEQKPAGNVKAK
jgi:outer membrane protein